MGIKPESRVNIGLQGSAWLEAPFYALSSAALGVKQQIFPASSKRT